MDTLGLVIAVVVTAASVQDRDGAKLVFAEAAKSPRLKKVWADGGYAGQLVEWTKTTLGWDLELERRPQEKGFHLIKHRWIVERTFGWLGRFRLLAKDYTAKASSSETDIRLAMIHIMARRLAPVAKPANDHIFAQAAYVLG